MSPGKLIVIEGTDGSGKATQTALMVERLASEGYTVKVADFPRYGKKSAALVEEYLNGKFGGASEVSPYQASIFYAVDRYAASFELRQWLKEGYMVICNRYVSASMGHQAGKIKNKQERSKFIAWLEDLEYHIFNIPKPDMNILLYLPPELGQSLVDKKGHREYLGGAHRDIHESDLTHLKEAAAAFREVAEEKKWAIIECAPGNQLKTKEDIHELIWEKVKKIVE